MHGPDWSESVARDESTWAGFFLCKLTLTRTRHGRGRQRGWSRGRQGRHVRGRRGHHRWNHRHRRHGAGRRRHRWRGRSGARRRLGRRRRDRRASGGLRGRRLVMMVGRPWNGIRREGDSIICRNRVNKTLDTGNKSEKNEGTLSNNIKLKEKRRSV
jgi:hypothetical protein